MKIKKEFPKGQVELEFMKADKILFEVPQGAWDEDVYRNVYMKAYEVDLAPELRAAGKWIKVCDMRGYRMSSIVESIQEHLKWCQENGLQEIIFIYPEQMLVKFQMTRSCKNIVEIKNYTDEKEAWDYARKLAKTL